MLLGNLGAPSFLWETLKFLGNTKILGILVCSKTMFLTFGVLKNQGFLTD